MQAPAGHIFRKILLGITGFGFVIIVLGLLLGVIPPPKDALADSSRMVSIYYDGQKKVVSVAGIPFRKQLDDIYTVTLSNGKRFTASLHHRMLTPSGWKPPKGYKGRVTKGETKPVLRGRGAGSDRKKG